MVQINLNSKTGFVAHSDFKIFDETGKLFYSSLFSNKIANSEPLKFNLPRGSYKLDGKIRRLEYPIPHKKIILPPKERFKKRQKFKIIFRENPNKCTIFWKKGLIVFDKFFLNVPKFILFDIYFHEMGHRFYTTEKYADLYASKRMLEIGFNKTQIGLSSLMTLGDNNLERKQAKVNSLK